jgi:uncharacterized protein
MKTKLAGILFGVGFGFILAWARLTDPRVIRDMLLLREANVFLIMGSAVAVAAIGVRILRAFSARSLLTGEPISWSLERPQQRHVIGSMLFGAGWSVAGTCPGPAAAMIGEGRLVGLVVTAGLTAGVVLHGVLERRRMSTPIPRELPGMAGL